MPLGLELRCHPCDNDVLVTSGYALSPCGDDIVVCEDEQVDICRLIRECLKQERQDQTCETYPAGNVTGCEEEEWLLMIRYEEIPSRGIAALRNASAEARCQPCDAVTFGSCDCDDNGKLKRQSHTASLRPQPVQCEPTVLCEGYRYEVCRVSGQDQQKSAMVLRFNQCVEPFTKLIQDLSNFETEILNANHVNHDLAKEYYSRCCFFKRSLTELLAKHPVHNCTLQEKMRQDVCPVPSGDGFNWGNYKVLLIDSLKETRTLLVIALMDCLRTTLLPTCEYSNDPRVVLGQVTVSKTDCKIQEVCNWITERKLVTTPPNLEYWLSWLMGPYIQSLRQQLSDVCKDVEDSDSDWLSGIKIEELDPKNALPSLLKELLISNNLPEKLEEIREVIAGTNEP